MKKLFALLIFSGIGAQAFTTSADSTRGKSLNADTAKICRVQRSLPSPLPDPSRFQQATGMEHH